MKKTTYIYNISLLVFLAIMFAGCSTFKYEEVKEENKTKSKFSLPKGVAEKEALQNFITGTGFETEGDYYSAINYYNKAYEYDPKAGISYTIAKNYYYLGKLAQALPYAKSAVEADKEFSEYYYLLSDIYSSARLPDSAIAVIEMLVKKHPNDYYSLYRLAHLYEKIKPLSAIEVYNRILEEEPEDWNAYIKLADLYDKTGNKEKSVEVLEQFLEFNPSSIELREILVSYLIQLKRFDSALKLLDDILLLFPDKISTLQAKAELFLDQKDYLKAAEPYTKLAGNPAVSLDFKINLCALYFEQAVKDTILIKAVDNILSEIEKDTVFWFTHFYRGANSVLKKDDEKAVKHFSNVKGDSYLYLQPWQRIGGILYDGKLYKESAFVFNEAYLNFPEDFLVNFFLGLSYALMGNYSASEPFLLKSTQLNPSEVNTYSAYAFSLSRLKKSDEAIINYRKALNIDPKNPELLNSLAIIYEGMSDYSISDSLYLQALKNDPKNALACNNYAYSLAKRSEKLDEALRMAELALSIDPNSPSYMDTYGWVQFKLGNFTVAKEYIEKALAMDGQNNELLDHYGDVMFKLGDKKTAIIFWKKALELNKDNQTIKMKIERGEI